MTKYLFVGFAITVSLGYFIIQDLRKQVEIVELNNQQLQWIAEQRTETIASLQKAISNVMEANNKLAEDMAKAEKERKEVAIKLNNYVGRLNNAAIKKPKLIENRVNDATAKLLQQFSEVTEN